MAAFKYAAAQAEVSALPRIVAMSYEGLSEIIHSVVPRYEGIASIRIVNKAFDEAVEAAEKLVLKGDVDVIITAGANASYLRDRIAILNRPDFPGGSNS